MKIFDLDDPFNFGKYKGFNISQFYFGFQNTTQEFDSFLINFFLKLHHEYTISLDREVSNKKIMFENIKVCDNRTLEISFTKNYSIENSMLLELLNYTFKQSQYHPSKGTHGEINRIILEGLRTNSLNKAVNNNKPFSSDVAYLSYCVKNIPWFALAENVIEEIHESECYDFAGLSFELTSDERILKFTPIIKRVKRILKDDVIEINLEKINKYITYRKSLKSETSENHKLIQNFMNEGCSVCESSNGCMASDPDLCPYS